MSDWKSKQLDKWMHLLDKPPSATRSWYWQRLRQRVDELVCMAIRLHGDPGLLLDYGAGTAPMSRHWQRAYHGWRVIAADLSEDDLRTVGLLPDPPSRVVLHAQHGPLRPDALDIITCSEVVEHLPAPKKLLADFYRWLKPGGVMVLTTPNAGHPLLRGRRPLDEDDDDRLATNEIGYGHISVYSTQTWKQWLCDLGFTDVKAYRGALLFGGEKWDRPARLLLLMAIEMMLDVLRASNWSESTILWARKPGE